MRRSASNDSTKCACREIVRREQLNLLLRLHAQFFGHCVGVGAWTALTALKTAVLANWGRGIACS
jgi:hypothetical protein